NKNLAEAMRQASDENAKAMKPIEDKVKKLNEEISRGGIADDQKARLQKRLLETEESRKSELRQQGDRVEKARQVAMMKTASSDVASEALRKAAETLSNNRHQDLKLQEELNEQKQIAKNGPGAETSTEIRQKLQDAHEETGEEIVKQVTK